MILHQVCTHPEIQDSLYSWGWWWLERPTYEFNQISLAYKFVQISLAYIMCTVCCNIDLETIYARYNLRFFRVTELLLCQSASIDNKCQPVNS